MYKTKLTYDKLNKKLNIQINLKRKKRDKVFAENFLIQFKISFFA